MLHNVVFVKKPEELRADVVAVRDIAPGEELYVDYGRWCVVQHPLLSPPLPRPLLAATTRSAPGASPPTHCTRRSCHRLTPPMALTPRTAPLSSHCLGNRAAHARCPFFMLAARRGATSDPKRLHSACAALLSSLRYWLKAPGTALPTPPGVTLPEGPCGGGSGGPAS